MLLYWKCFKLIRICAILYTIKQVTTKNTIPAVFEGDLDTDYI